jgi:CRISPR-associated protein Cmr5
MKNIEKILPSAIESVKNNVLNGSEVPKEFNGYISSFGASITMSGLLPTLVFFSQEVNANARGNRKSVIAAIEEIIKTEYSSLLTGTHPKLLKTVIDQLNDPAKIERLQDKIQEAAIALKLAIRIFPKSKN